MKEGNRYSGVLFCCIAGMALYYWMGYQLERSNFVYLICLYGGLSGLFYYMIKHRFFTANTLLGTGILFRLLLLFSIPDLSQDFYRFIWDGRLLLQGYNPYLHLPDALINKPGFSIADARELYNGMGSLSAGHYTNYPPLNQLCFAVAAFLGGKSIAGCVIVFKLIIISADIGIFCMGKKLLQRFQLPEKNIFLYFLNPLVIVELTGNLHFEGVMVFFLIVSIYFLHTHNYLWAALFMAFSISIKLVPVMFLPLLIRQRPVKKLVIFYGTTALVTVLLFAPFFSAAFARHFTGTVALWFVNFEFNASIYYLIRWIGFALTGQNIIQVVGRVTPFIIIGIIVAFARDKRNTDLRNAVINMLLVLTVYFFLSTTVHPWYIVTLIGLGIFTGYQFPLVWSTVIILSYFAYSNIPFKESPWLLFAEYLVVYSFFFHEIRKKSKQDAIASV